jgi:2-aminoethylphosphonate-pyruvate transaminase
LDRCEGQCHSVSLDLHAQAARLARDGQFRFTPPTHVLAALDRALALHEAEGGVEGRGRRYRGNCEVLLAGLSRLGLRTLLAPERQAPIIVTVLAPSDPAWDFAWMYAALNERGYSIYPGKLTERETFRVGCIGQVFPSDMQAFVDALGEVLDAQGVHQREPKEEQERT